MKDKKILIGIAGIVVIVIAVAAFVSGGNNDSQDSLNDLSALQNQAQFDPSETVAIINGEAITRGELQVQLQQLQQNPQAQNATAQDLQSLALDQIVSSRLLVMAAKEADITADEETVDAEMQNVLGQFESPEAADQQLAQVGMSRDSLREDIADQLILTGFYEKIVADNNVEISDEEVQGVYDEQVAPQENAPSLEEVRPQIENQLKQQKIQPYLATILEDYRESAEIEVLL